MKTNPHLIPLAMFLLGLFGCSHSSSRQESSIPAPELTSWSGSSVEIDYMLGHTERHLRIDARDSRYIRAESLHGEESLKKRDLDPARYAEFRAKVAEFVERRRGLASEVSPDCQNPYRIVLRHLKDTVKYHGCRTGDEGAFGRLVKDGEFLLYSRK